MNSLIKQFIPRNIKNVWHRLRTIRDPWIEHFKFLVKRDILPYLPKTTNESKPITLFWTPFAIWPHMIIEFFIAIALRLRGFEVKFAVCNGHLPHCEMERAKFRRPSCEMCFRLTRKRLAAFGFTYYQLSDYINMSEINQVTLDIEKKNYQQLVNLVYDGYEVGHFSALYLTTYYQGLVNEIGASELITLRRIIAGNLLAYTYARRLLNEYVPDLVITLNGNVCQTQPGFTAFRNAGIRVVTWDDYPPYKDSFIWSHNEPSIFGSINDKLWETISIQPLSNSEEREIQSFLDEWARGRIGDIIYHPTPVNSPDRLRRRLGIHPTKRLFVAYTNVVWDSSCLGQNVGFDGMIDWIFTLCDWFADHQSDTQLIIRVHPGERRLPKDYQTIIGVSDIIKQRYKDSFPSNLIMVGAEDDAYSYSLADMADGIGVYTSSLGYELAARGKRVWVAGKVHYREHGFTLDISNGAHLKSLLDKKNWDNRLTQREIEFARRYIYFRLFRQVVRIPFLSRTKTQYLDHPYFNDLHFLLPKEDPLFNELIDRIIHGYPIVDIPYNTTANWTYKKMRSGEK